MNFLTDLGMNLVRMIGDWRPMGCWTFPTWRMRRQARLSGCCKIAISYFQRNPYGEWFDKLEPVLQGCKASYYDGSACHLDLVQWATKPTWGDLRPREIRDRLINADAEFLRQQLTNGSVKLLLANGKSVIDQLRRRYDARLMEVDGIRNYNTRFFVGTILDNVCVIAWSTYLQSRFVTAEWRTAIAGRVAQLGRDLCCIN